MDIRVAVFEDNKLIRDALEAIISGTSGFVCTGAYSDCNQLHSDIRRSSPDVVMMDIEMPGMNGIEATAVIRNEFPEIKILMQTVFNDASKIFKALCAGASGYILKTDSPSRQLEAIQEVFNGGATMSPAIAKKVVGFFQNKNVILTIPSESDFGLSKREQEILSLMAQGHNFKTISASAFISYETVRTHVKKIYRKLHVASKSEAVLKATQQGLI